MRERGLFNGSPADIICILAVYLELIREEVFNFVDSWNNHHIRKQKNRPYLPTGRPWMLYFHPDEGTKDYANEVDNATLERLKASVEYYGIILIPY